MFDRFRALSVRQQVLLAAILVAASCALLGSIWFFLLRVPYQPLFTGLRPADAAAIVADLDKKKIPYRLADGGATILVPGDIADRTRLDVMTEDVPLKGTVGFELFDKSDLGLTDFAQRINYQRALQGELERTIGTLDGVDAARVHLSLGEDRIFSDDRIPPKASVTIRMQKGFVLAPNSAQGIQRLIAAAVPNLEAANVVILDEQGRIVGAPAAVRADIGLPPPPDEAKFAIEQYYQARARAALQRVYPLAGLGVDVSLQTPSAPMAPQTLGDAADWNPASRNFPLKITVIASGVLDAATRNDIRNVVATAVNFDLAKNDAIEFGPASISPAKVAPSARSAAIPPVASYDLAQSDGGFLQPVVTMVLFFVLAGIAGILLWRLRRPKTLSDAQREQLALKLRALLEQGDQHAVP